MKRLPTVELLRLIRRPKPFDHADWMFEIKMDGFRSAAYISPDGCRLVSRNGNVFNEFDSLGQYLSDLPVRSAILDGEIVCLDGNGHSRFNELLFRRGLPYFYAFDLLWLNGKDMRGLPLIERKERLKRVVLESQNPALVFADHIEQYGTDFFRIICERDLEGIVAKHRDSRYDRSARWIKIKNPTYSQARGRHELFESHTSKNARKIA